MFDVDQRNDAILDRYLNREEVLEKRNQSIADDVKELILDSLELFIDELIQNYTFTNEEYRIFKEKYHIEIRGN